MLLILVQNFCSRRRELDQQNVMSHTPKGLPQPTLPAGFRVEARFEWGAQHDTTDTKFTAKRAEGRISTMAMPRQDTTGRRRQPSSPEAPRAAGASHHVVVVYS